MITYRTRSSSTAALLFQDGRFTYTGHDRKYFLFSGEEGLTPDLSGYADIASYFQREYQQAKGQNEQIRP